MKSKQVYAPLDADDIVKEPTELTAGALAPAAPSGANGSTPATVRGEVAPMLRLAVPIALSQLVDGVTQQVSISMIGHLGPEMLGAAVLTPAPQMIPWTLAVRSQPSSTDSS
jgi:hypothetical protein